VAAHVAVAANEDIRPDFANLPSEKAKGCQQEQREEDGWRRA
jgi:hypothetical protein